MISQIFSINGRTSRTGFWLHLLIFALVFVALAATASFLIPLWFGHLLPLELPPRRATVWIGSLMAGIIPVAIPALFLIIRRLHDRNHPGWWIVTPLTAKILIFTYAAPLIASGSAGLLPLIITGLCGLILVWFFIEVALLPGTDGDNGYGPAP